ncbi:hypothetical protein SKAU_G00034460 [Synaphobranchus kaupii]|uniref:Uncharacterized protein n=1 Tax=Synaphobranchus kaupii TaxID=118154 RepID=A0A9Q1GFM2_SYNKA|nr:hypothetical protein SKAU_G00034460 [Synaphobranchus kaupii]
MVWISTLSQAFWNPGWKVRKNLLELIPQVLPQMLEAHPCLLPPGLQVGYEYVDRYTDVTRRPRVQHGGPRLAFVYRRKKSEASSAAP